MYFFSKLFVHRTGCTGQRVPVTVTEIYIVQNRTKKPETKEYQVSKARACPMTPISVIVHFERDCSVSELRDCGRGSAGRGIASLGKHRVLHT